MKAAKQPDKRTRFIDAAVALAYRQGFRKTTLADIAEEAGVPLGNVYYYYKTKEEIGDAILALRLTQFEKMRAHADRLPSPRERLEMFIRITLDNRDNVARSGCPMGSLCAELLKEGGALADRSNALFAKPMQWIEDQFVQLGQGDKSAALALHFLSALQGVSLLAQSFRDPQLVEIEARHLTAWLDGLAGT